MPVASNADAIRVVEPYILEVSLTGPNALLSVEQATPLNNPVIYDSTEAKKHATEMNVISNIAAMEVSDFDTKITFQDLEVLKSTPDDNMYVLKVDLHQAEQISHVVQLAPDSFSLALRPGDDVPAQAEAFHTLRPGEDSNRSSPARPETH